MEDGLSPADAEKADIFIPLAFGRVRKWSFPTLPILLMRKKTRALKWIKRNFTMPLITLVFSQVKSHIQQVSYSCF